MPAPVVLYGTTACGLCNEARRIVLPVAGAFGWRVDEVDVALDDGLFERFGERVPVLVRADLDAELAWPFDVHAVRALLARPRAG